MTGMKKHTLRFLSLALALTCAMAGHANAAQDSTLSVGDVVSRAGTVAQEGFALAAFDKANTVTHFMHCNRRALTIEILQFF